MEADMDGTVVARSDGLTVQLLGTWKVRAAVERVTIRTYVRLNRNQRIHGSEDE